MPTMETTPNFPNAACKTGPFGAFHPDRLELGYAAFNEAQREAVALCNTCEHRPVCLTHAIETDEEDGIWGGTTEADRAAIRWAHGADKRAQRWNQQLIDMVATINSLDGDSVAIEQIVKFVRLQRNKLNALTRAVNHALPGPDPATNPEMVTLLRSLEEHDGAAWQLGQRTGLSNALRLVGIARDNGRCVATGERNQNPSGQTTAIYRITDKGREWLAVNG